MSGRNSISGDHIAKLDITVVYAYAVGCATQRLADAVWHQNRAEIVDSMDWDGRQYHRDQAAMHRAAAYSIMRPFRMIAADRARSIRRELGDVRVELSSGI